MPTPILQRVRRGRAVSIGLLSSALSVGETSCAIPIASGAGAEPVPAVRMAGMPAVYELRNGRWFDGHRFIAGTRYTVHGAITDRRPEPVDSVIDLLHGGYVVPPSARRTTTMRFHRTAASPPAT